MRSQSDESKQKFYMEVDRTLKDQFQSACGGAPMTAVTQELWRIFINSSREDKYDIIQSASRYTS